MSKEPLYPHVPKGKAGGAYITLDEQGLMLPNHLGYAG